MKPEEGHRPSHLLEEKFAPGDSTIPTLELLWRAAPEQVKELDRLFKSGVQTRAIHGPSPVLAANYTAIQISEEFLQQMWLLTHGAWEDLENYYKLKESGDLKSYNARRTEESVDAARGIAESGQSTWPEWIPPFLDIQRTQKSKAIRELFAMACVWAIFHEAQHAIFYETDKRPDSKLEEERLCDAYALDMLFSDIEKYVQLTGEPADKVAGKRAMGALVALYTIAKLSNPSFGGDDHPPARERILALLDRLEGTPAAQFWSFAFGLVLGLCKEPEKLRPDKDSTISEVVRFMVENIDG